MNMWLFSFVLLALTSQIVDSADCTYHMLKPTGSNQSNIITSPNYPSQYPPNVCLLWVLPRKPRSLFTFRMLDIDLPGHTRSGFCLRDNDSVMIGPVTRKRFCGRNSAPGDLYRIAMTPPGSVIFVIFNSTGIIPKGRGFKAEYWITTAGEESESAPSIGNTSDTVKNQFDLAQRMQKLNDMVKGYHSNRRLASNGSQHSDLDNSSHNCNFYLHATSGSIFLNTSTLKMYREFGNCTWTIGSSESDVKRVTRIKIWFRNCDLSGEDTLKLVDLDVYRMWQITAQHCPNFILSHGERMKVMLSYSKNAARIHAPSLVLYYQILTIAEDSSSKDEAGINFSERNSLSTPDFTSLPECDYILANMSKGAISGPSETSAMLERCGGQLTWLVTAAIPDHPFRMSTLGFEIRIESCPPDRSYTKDKVEVFDGLKSSTSPVLTCDGRGNRSHKSFGSSFLVRYHTYNPDSPQLFRLTFIRRESLCPPDSYSCNIGGHYCYNDKDRCNGKGTCTNYMDEMNCDASKCNSGKGLFLCANKRCIYEKWRCDGTSDCEDNSDEEACGSVTTPLVIVAATVGCLICSLMLVSALGCVCKKYRQRQSHIMTVTSDGNGQACECGAGNHSSRYESPLSRQIAEMFRQRPPPPPYHEAMLTSRPYREAAQMQMMLDGARVMTLAGDGADNGHAVSQPQDGTHTRETRGTASDAETGTHQSSSSNQRRSRRSTGQHRCVNQEAVDPAAPLSSHTHQNAALDNSGFIQVGSLALLDGMGDAQPMIRLEEPPPYSLSDPITDIAMGFVSNHIGDNDNMHSTRPDVSHGNSGRSVISRVCDIGDNNESFTGTQTHMSDCDQNISLSNTGSSHCCTSSPSTCVSGTVTVDGVSKEVKNGPNKSSRENNRNCRGSLQNDSDDDCILGDEDKDVDDGDNDGGDEEIDDDYGGNDSDDSDTACLLSAV